ncbi:hypothetical protein [Escherichia coli]|uniref:phage tail fiber protein n=1 Tax=Escherichia coli TaxID=562 RepID=UPI001F4BAEC0|nr:hypothetical protein [Escherichia coli]
MWYREGTITFTQGSNTLVGAGTAWNVTANGVLPGMIVIGPDNKLYEIKRVISDTNIVLSEPYTGETQSEVPCRIITTYEGDLTQFSARFTALMSRMSADSKSIRSWLTALDEVTIEREDGTEVTVKPLMQIVNEHNENVEWYKNNTDAIDAAGDKAREAAASAAAAAKSANAAGEKASQASQSASAAASSQSAASASATAAKKSETNAAASQKSAATSASTATTKASEAATSARDASASKVAAKSSETSAASSAGSAASSATAAGNSAKAAKTSETNADNSARAAADSQTASANSATAAKKSETNAKNSESAAKVSETNAKASENKAKEYLDKVGGLVSPMTQYDWPVVTGNESFYIKIAKLSDPGSNNCHVTLMVTNAGNYGSTYGNIDFIEISARGLPSSLTADNVSRYLSIRRLGATGLTDDNQMRYGLVKGDGFIEVWALQRAFINGAKVAVLAQTARTELYIPDGFVKQTAAPSGYVEGNVVRIYDQVNKPTKADLGLSNAMLTGAFGLGGSGIATTGKMSDVEILKALRDKGGHFWRGDKPTGSTATIYSHGSGIFSRCGDTWSAINIDYSTAKIKIYAGNDARLNNGNFSVNELYGSANKPSKSDVGLGNVTNDAQVKKTGDTMTGGLTFANDSILAWIRNTDWAKIGFKNDADGDTDSYMWFETGDNGNEYFKWRSRQSTTTKDLMNLKWDALSVLVKALFSSEVKISTVNALRIFNSSFGAIFRRSEESLYIIPTRENEGENGDIGPLRPFNINLRTGVVSVGHGLNVTGGVNGSLNGNASTATKLQTARTINGVSFDGSKNIELTPRSIGTINSATMSFIGGAGWFKLATVTMPQASSVVYISLIGGAGYNVGSPQQAGISELVLRAGNGNPKGITGALWRRTSVGFTNFAWVNTSGDTYDVYVEIGNYATGVNIQWDYTSNASVTIHTSPTYTANKPTGLTDGTVYVIYSSHIKPTATDVGALPITGGNLNGGLTAAGEIISKSANGLRIAYGNYAFFIRNDGSNTYFMLTDSGNSLGTYNRLRPLIINNANGAVTIGNGLNVTGGINGSLNGNAATATKLQTARTIGGVSFDGSANINLPGVNIAGNQNTTGNAATATKLQTACTINGVSFDGSKNIELTAEDLNLEQTVELAAGSLQKNQNGADIPDKDRFLSNINVYSKGEVDKKKGMRQYAFNAPSNAVGGKWYPVIFRRSTGSTGELASRVIITTTSAGGNYEMNNCEFNGMVMPGGWTDRGSYAAGYFSTYQTNERAIHSIVTSLKEDDVCSVFYVEGRAFPVRVSAEEGLTVIVPTQDYTVGQTTYKWGATNPATESTNAQAILDFNNGRGFYCSHSIFGINAIFSGNLGIGTANALGGNSIVLGDNDTGFKQNGDGVLDAYANGVHVFRFRNGSAISLKGIQTGESKLFTLSSSNTAARNASFNLWGNSSRPTVAELGDDSGWHFYSQRNTDNSVIFSVNGQIQPNNWGNFDSRYVKDVRLGTRVVQLMARGGRYEKAGHAITGLRIIGEVDGDDEAIFRPIQKYINGTWYNVAQV